MFDRASPFLPLRPPQARSRNVVAMQRLRQALIFCEIRPGASFGEAETADRFRLGRAAIRVALTSLAAGGFVERQPRQGWRAANVTGALIGDVVAARRRLEPALLERPPEAREAARLVALAQTGAAAIAAGDRKALSTARSLDRQILDALAARAGVFAARWLGEAWDHCARIAHLADGARAFIWPSDRQPLLAALSRGDETAARAEIERDIAQFETGCTALLLNSAPMDGAHRETSARARSARRRRNSDAPHAAIVSRPIEGAEP